MRLPPRPSPQRPRAFPATTLAGATRRTPPRPTPRSPIRRRAPPSPLRRPHPPPGPPAPAGPPARPTPLAAPPAPPPAAPPAPPAPPPAAPPGPPAQPSSRCPTTSPPPPPSLPPPPPQAPEPPALPADRGLIRTGGAGKSRGGGSLEAQGSRLSVPIVASARSRRCAHRGVLSLSTWNRAPAEAWRPRGSGGTLGEGIMGGPCGVAVDNAAYISPYFLPFFACLVLGRTRGPPVRNSSCGMSLPRHLPPGWGASGLHVRVWVPRAVRRTVCP